MAYKYRHEGLSRGIPNYSLPSDSDDSSVSEDDTALDKTANDRQLRQAIHYLVTKGGSDSAETYVDRVGKIDEGIVREYLDQGYSFDPGLYERLRAMVEETQADFQRIREPSSSQSEPPLDSDDEVEETTPLESLYRSPSVGTILLPSQSQGRPSPGRAKAPTPDINRGHGRDANADVRSRQWLYGGPDNEVEEWFKDFPPSLPFGETLYMQEWESMKINYDLRESAKSEEPITTNVPYSAPLVTKRFQIKDIYDSGSRFKLPYISAVNRGILGKYALSLEDAVEDFNQGGPARTKRQHHVPRIMLPKVSTSPKVPTKPPQNAAPMPKGKSKAPGRGLRNPENLFGDGGLTDLAGGYPAPPSTLPNQVRTTVRTPRAPRRPITSRVGTVNPDISPQAHAHRHGATPSEPSTPTPASRVARRLERVRKDATQRDASVLHRESQRPVVLDDVTGAVIGSSSRTPPSSSKRKLGHVEIPKRKPGRPRKDLLAAGAPGGRENAHEVDNMNPRVPRTTKKDRRVSFAGPENDPNTVIAASSSSSGAGLRQGAAAGYQQVRRGTLRSGAKFDGSPR